MNSQLKDNIYKRDKIISQAVCIQITLVGIKNMLVQAVPFLYARNSMLNIGLLLIIGIIYIYAYSHSCKSIHINTFFLAVFIVVSFFVTLIIFPQNTPYIINILPRAIPFCFLTWILLTKLTTFKWIEYYMNRYSLVILVFSLISAMFIFKIGHISMSEWSTYSMPLSYVTMVAVMWILKRYLNEEKIRWICLAILGIIVIIIYGSRNPLLAIAAFIIISVARKVSGGSGKTKIKYLVITFIGCIIMVFWKELLILFGKFLETYSISSRTILLLTSDKISTSGRDVIHSTLWSALNQHPFFGFGVLGDEVVLSSVSQSAHGLYLSILSNYGYFIGGVLLALLIYWNLCAYKKANGVEKDILLMYMCMVWPRGFTGGDIWTSDVFWWMIGLTMSILSYKRSLVTE